MLKYGKVMDDKGLCQVGIGENVDFYKSIGFTLLDVEKSEIDGDWYLAELCPKKPDEEKLKELKALKIKENDEKRDIALNSGVIYKDILFDSDTDQKVNLLATIGTMADLEVITWFGADNKPLNATKEDLINIGGLITELHSFCWNKNAEIKGLIELAETKEEVMGINIEYKIEE